MSAPWRACLHSWNQAQPGSGISKSSEVAALNVNRVSWRAGTQPSHHLKARLLSGVHGASTFGRVTGVARLPCSPSDEVARQGSRARLHLGLLGGDRAEGGAQRGQLAERAGVQGAPQGQHRHAREAGRRARAPRRRGEDLRHAAHLRARVRLLKINHTAVPGLPLVCTARKHYIQGYSSVIIDKYILNMILYSSMNIRKYIAQLGYLFKARRRGRQLSGGGRDVLDGLQAPQAQRA